MSNERSNGVNTQETERGWRETALDECLRGFDNAENFDALLCAVRRNLPECTTVSLWLDWAQVRAFLEQDCEDLQELLATHHGTYQRYEKTIRPYLGWLSVRWQGTVIELVLTPNDSEESRILCAASDGSVLTRFVDALAAYALRPRGRCLRYSEGWENAPEIEAELSKVTWDDLVFPRALLAQVQEAVIGFAHHQEAYRNLGFAWRRGILLVGPPGTGKTMICKAAASSLSHLPFLYVRDLLTYNEREAIKSIFERARELAPCILAIEDIDGLITEANRTVFLNELDGFQNNEGILLIASSNHPGQIDEALLKRPSRFDRVFHIGLPDAVERREFCRRVLTRPGFRDRIAPEVDLDALCDKAAAGSPGFTPAYLKEALLSAALQQAQAGVEILDERFAVAVLAQVEELRLLLKRLSDPAALAEMTGGDNVMGLRR